MKEAYINAKILDPEKSKEYLGDIIIEKTKIIDVGPNNHKKEIDWKKNPSLLKDHSKIDL